MSEYWERGPRETRAQAIARINAEHGWPESAKGAEPLTPPAMLAERRNWMERVRERFAPPMDRASVAARLHIEVGDPDADGDWGDEGRGS